MERKCKGCGSRLDAGEDFLCTYCDENEQYQEPDTEYLEADLETEVSSLAYRRILNRQKAEGTR